MLHDPEIYDSPMEFTPERFNGDDAEIAKVTDLVFGFGRRLCPGRNFAEGTLFANIATALATCRILPGKNEKGEEVLPKYAYTSGIIRYVFHSSIAAVCAIVHCVNLASIVAFRDRMRLLCYRALHKRLLCLLKHQ